MPNPNSDSVTGDSRSGRRDATLERLLDGAQATFAERGYAAANIHEICARAKVGIGTFYAHFENKRELLQQVMERAPRFSSALTVKDLLERPRIVGWLQSAVDDQLATGLWRAWHQAVLEESDLTRFHSSMYAKSMSDLSDLVRQARARTEPRPGRAEPAVVAWTILTLTRELGIHDRTSAPGVDELADLIYRLVA
jgi:AcrR family transcriptional regulator